MRTDTCLLEIKLVASLNFYGTGFNKNRPFYVLLLSYLYLYNDKHSTEITHVHNSKEILGESS